MHQNMNTYPHRKNVNLICLQLFNQVLYANATDIINHYMSRCSILVSTSTEEGCDSITHSVLSNSYCHWVAAIWYSIEQSAKMQCC